MATSTSADVEIIHKKLISEWKSNNMTNIRSLLGQLQEAMFKVPIKQLSKETTLTIYKDYYELGALYYMIQGDLDQFDQAIKEVEAFYETQQDSTGARAFKSQQQYLMYGLHLMFLLATNKISEFRMFIERIDYNKRKTDPFLEVPIKLEHYLMEGAYNKMILTEKNLPTPYYKPFINKLKQSIQNEIAVSLEKSYRTIPIKTAMKQLFNEDEKETLAFGTKRGWIRKGNDFLITGTELNNDDAQQPVQKKLSTVALADGMERILQPLDSQRIINQCLNYAIQLERIV